MLSGNAVEETNNDDNDTMVALITLLPTLVKQREQKAYKASVSLTVWGHFLVHFVHKQKGVAFRLLNCCCDVYSWISVHHYTFKSKWTT